MGAFWVLAIFNADDRLSIRMPLAVVKSIITTMPTVLIGGSLSHVAVRFLTSISIPFPLLISFFSL